MPASIAFFLKFNLEFPLVEDIYLNCGFLFSNSCIIFLELSID